MIPVTSDLRPPTPSEQPTGGVRRSATTAVNVLFFSLLASTAAMACVDLRGWPSPTSSISPPIGHRCSHEASWKHVEILKDSFPFIEELHLVGNKLKEIAPSSSTFVKGFDSLHLLNLDDNCIDSWEEILKLSQLKSLEQLFLNHNNLSCIWYPDHGTLHETANVDECLGKGSKPFKNLHSLLLGNNKIKDVESVDSLNYFPNLLEVRLSENPVTDPVKSGLSRFVLVACLAGLKIINGSEAFTVRYWKASNILLTWFDFETLMQ